MTESGEVPCTRCGEPVRADAMRCPHCAANFPGIPGAEHAPPPEPSRPPTWSDAPPPPPPAPPPPPPAPETSPVTAPLSFQPPPSPPEPAEGGGTDGGRSSRWGGALVALLVVVVPVVAFALWSSLSGDDDASPTTTTEVVGPTSTSGPEVAGSESAGTWIMALASHTDEGRAEAQADSLSDLGAGVLRSDDWASLVPGYWVVYVGGFGDGDAVLARCAELGREVPNACVGRFLSTDPADRDLIAR